jgi:hypothetical protein
MICCCLFLFDGGGVQASFVQRGTVGLWKIVGRWLVRYLKIGIRRRYRGNELATQGRTLGQIALGTNHGILGTASFAASNLTALTTKIFAIGVLGYLAAQRRTFGKFAFVANDGIFRTARFAALCLTTFATVLGGRQGEFVIVTGVVGVIVTFVVTVIVTSVLVDGWRRGIGGRYVGRATTRFCITAPRNDARDGYQRQKGRPFFHSYYLLRIRENRE